LIKKYYLRERKCVSAGNRVIVTLYNDSMMAMVIGRNNARRTSDDQGMTSIGMLGSTVVRLAYSAPNPADVNRYKSMVKQWMNEAASQNPLASLGSIQLIELTKSIMNDPDVSARGELLLNKQYPNMSRAVHRRLRHQHVFR
jgi:hypothetical protein